MRVSMRGLLVIAALLYCGGKVESRSTLKESLRNAVRRQASVATQGQPSSRTLPDKISPGPGSDRCTTIAVGPKVRDKE